MKMAILILTALIMVALSACSKEAASQLGAGGIPGVDNPPSSSQPADSAPTAPNDPEPPIVETPANTPRWAEDVPVREFAEDLPNGFAMYTAQVDSRGAMFSNDVVVIRLEAILKDNFQDDLYSVHIGLRCASNSGAPTISFTFEQLPDYATKISGSGIYTAGLARFLYDMMAGMGDSYGQLLGLSADGLHELSECIAPGDPLTSLGVTMSGDGRARTLNFSTRDNSLGDLGGFGFEGAPPIYTSPNLLQDILELLLQYQ
ncbi:hypothetical protein FWG76_02875 [Candidatus Saccharibacteria bacterium]|nr:hypothetical protein [Candidatus Saccharibacteria bacterium]